MIKTIITDDEPNARERIRTLIAQDARFQLVAECSDGVEAVAAIRRERPDLLLLDIQMPGLDGFGVLAHLLPQEVPLTIFITAYDEHAIKAFDVGAVDYVLKPIVPARLATALTRALERLAQGKRLGPVQLPPLLRSVQQVAPWLDSLIVEQRGRMVLLPTAQVHWLEATGNYVRVHSDQGSHLMRATLTMLESRLDPQQFLRVHRSAIVALNRVTLVEPGAHGDARITLRDGTTLAAARGRASELRARLRSS